MEAHRLLRFYLNSIQLEIAGILSKDGANFEVILKNRKN